MHWCEPAPLESNARHYGGNCQEWFERTRTPPLPWKLPHSQCAPAASNRPSKKWGNAFSGWEEDANRPKIFSRHKDTFTSTDRDSYGVQTPAPCRFSALQVQNESNHILAALLSPVLLVHWYHPFQAQTLLLCFETNCPLHSAPAGCFGLR